MSCAKLIRLAGLIVGVLASLALRPAPASAQEADGDFAAQRDRLTERLTQQFDVSNPALPLDGLHAGCPSKDCIPALTMPARISAVGADFPTFGGRVIVVEIGREAVAYPVNILNYHEVVNDVVGGVPIVVTWCPLCDSAAVMKRTYTDEEGRERTLEFGIAGFLFHSNMVMYDRTTNGLWSQVFMRALTGPLAGTRLEHLPVRVMPFAQFQQRHPRGAVLSRDTGYNYPYQRNVYERYLASPDVPPQFAFEFDERLPAKTLGVGVSGDGFAVFAPASALGDDGLTIDTPRGPVVVRRNDAGVETVSAPEGVAVIQTFYHSFSAFHPGCEIARGK